MAAKKGSRGGNNEGSIYRYRNGWAGQVSLPDGSRPTFYGPTREDVQEKIRKALRAVEDGVPVVTTRITVGEYLDQWVTVVLPSRVVSGTLAESTAESYADQVRLHLVPILGHHELRKLAPAHVRQWMTRKLTEPSAAGLAQRAAWDKAAAEKTAQRAKEAAERAPSGRARRKPATKQTPAPERKPVKPLSARSVAYALTILTAALGDAVRDELITRNVAALVQPPCKADAQVRSLDEQEARKVVAVALVDRMAPLWLVLLALGLRKGEALALHWDALDLDAGTIAIVRKQRRRRAGIDPETGKQRWELVEDENLKTRGSKAVLALPEMVVAVLLEHQRRQDQAKQEAKEKAEKHGIDVAELWADDGLVLTTEAGRPIDPRNVNRWWDAVCAQAGVRRVRVHDLRHTAATLLFRAGVDLNEIRALLRHTRIGTTADIYVDVLEDVRRGTARTMDGILTRLHGPEDVTDRDERPKRSRAPER
ncbi:tyrosine-type recombinase/integrase [Frankia sp. AgB1.9]|uniref:site-specific integrase n=1 Tax=unclassified Frankia TaxID=2632575 RepID=UPI001932B5E3|nr:MULTISPECIES: tyrosine-type recombinase/integrase [unclassified Frankia]MBL7487611.1 tyrosine-type recombinase/integrase [Frankia sp. AgW1.1]MBL7548923.1 tyrosine-type recombinase/integrase [Frankia sp. AgB1.9]MBL7624891.1 tyrosine-type recombinase/integrase [Frankia sp. AgB1.8]